MDLKPADTPDSQEICFVPNDNYRELIELRNPGINEKLAGGDLVFNDEKIGSHKGYPYYTIGQRRGLNVAVGKKIYVSKIDFCLGAQVSGIVSNAALRAVERCILHIQRRHLETAM